MFWRLHWKFNAIFENLKRIPRYSDSSRRNLRKKEYPKNNG
jgi:hypothetical protein